MSKKQWLNPEIKNLSLENTEACPSNGAVTLDAPHMYECLGCKSPLDSYEIDDRVTDANGIITSGKCSKCGSTNINYVGCGNHTFGS